MTLNSVLFLLIPAGIVFWWREHFWRRCLTRSQSALAESDGQKAGLAARMQTAGTMLEQIEREMTEEVAEEGGNTSFTTAEETRQTVAV